MYLRYHKQRERRVRKDSGEREKIVASKITERRSARELNACKFTWIPCIYNKLYLIRSYVYVVQSFDTFQNNEK